MEREEFRRLFVALRPPCGVTDELSVIQGELQDKIDRSRHSNGGRIRWTREEQLHLTLVFSSAFPESRLDALKTALTDTCAARHPFEVRLAAPETRPSHRDPQVIWSPVASGLETLREFHAVLSRHFEGIQHPAGSAIPRGFVPHVTLGRVARGGSRRFSHAVQDAVSDGFPPSSAWLSREVELLESLLGTAGARHTVLQVFPLAGEP